MFTPYYLGCSSKRLIGEMAKSYGLTPNEASQLLVWVRTITALGLDQMVLFTHLTAGSKDNRRTFDNLKVIFDRSAKLSPQVLTTALMLALDRSLSEMANEAGKSLQCDELSAVATTMELLGDYLQEFAVPDAHPQLVKNSLESLMVLFRIVAMNKRMDVRVCAGTTKPSRRVSDYPLFLAAMIVGRRCLGKGKIGIVLAEKANGRESYYVDVFNCIEEALRRELAITETRLMAKGENKDTAEERHWKELLYALDRVREYSRVAFRYREAYENFGGYTVSQTSSGLEVRTRTGRPFTRDVVGLAADYFSNTQPRWGES